MTSSGCNTRGVFAVLVTGPPGSGKTVALTALLDALAEDGIPHAAPFATWLQQTKGSHRYGPVRDFRHSQIHRTIRQDAKVLGAGVGATPTGVTTSGPDPAKPATHERGALIRDVADFVPERWRSFWELFT